MFQGNFSIFFKLACQHLLATFLASILWNDVVLKIFPESSPFIYPQAWVKSQDVSKKGNTVKTRTFRSNVVFFADENSPKTRWKQQIHIHIAKPNQKHTIYPTTHQNFHFARRATKTGPRGIFVTTSFFLRFSLRILNRNPPISSDISEYSYMFELWYNVM